MSSVQELTATAPARVPDAPAPSPPEIIPLAPALGAEIRGIDAAAIDDAAFAFLRDVLHRYSVIVLRDQRLSPPDQVALAKRLGRLRVSSYNKDNNFAVPGHPDLAVVSNIVENGRPIGVMDAGVLWHTDASYLATPDMYTVLYAIDVPRRGDEVLGDTLFVSTAAAHDALPDDLRRELEGRKAVHSFLHHIDKKREKGNLKRPALTGSHKREVPDVEHPIVRTHPFTGRKCLFATEGHTKSVTGLTDAASDKALERLWTHVTRPEFLYRHRWRAGDLLIWDNCATQHLAIQDYGNLPRRLHRAGIAGFPTE